MSRKDYIKIADVLSEIPLPTGADAQEWKHSIVERFADMLADDNPRFSYDKFVQAAEGEDVVPFTDYQESQGATALPTLGDYTVDMRCREFRRVLWSKSGEPGGIKTIPFESKQGERLLGKLTRFVIPATRLWDELVNIF